jgi:hypothetical protein
LEISDAGFVFDCGVRGRLRRRGRGRRFLAVRVWAASLRVVGAVVKRGAALMRGASKSSVEQMKGRLIKSSFALFVNIDTSSQAHKIRQSRFR